MSPTAAETRLQTIESTERPTQEQKHAAAVNKLAGVLNLSYNDTNSILRRAARRLNELEAKKSGGTLTPAEQTEEKALTDNIPEVNDAAAEIAKLKVEEKQKKAELRREFSQEINELLTDDTKSNRYTLARQRIAEVRARGYLDDGFFNGLEDTLNREIQRTATRIISQLEAAIRAAGGGINIGNELNSAIEAASGGTLDQELADAIDPQEIRRLEALNADLEAVAALDAVLRNLGDDFDAVYKATQTFDNTANLSQEARDRMRPQIEQALEDRFERALEDVETKIRGGDDVVTAIGAVVTAQNGNLELQKRLNAQKAELQSIEDEVNDEKATNKLKTDLSTATNYDNVANARDTFNANTRNQETRDNANQEIEDALDAQYQTARTRVEAEIRAGNDVTTAINDEVTTNHAGNNELRLRLEGDRDELESLEEETGNESLSNNTETFTNKAADELASVPVSIPITITIDATNYIFSNMGELRTRIIDAQNADHIDDGADVYSLISEQLTDRLKTLAQTEMYMASATDPVGVPAPAGSNPFGTLAWGIRELNHRVSTGILDVNVMAETVQELNRLHGELVNNFVEAAAPGMSEADWRAALASRNPDAIVAAEQELYWQSRKEDLEIRLKFEQEIDDMIEQMDPGLIDADYRIVPGYDSYLRTYISGRNLLNWQEEEYLASGIDSPLIVYAERKINATTVKHSMNEVDNLSPTDVQGQIEQTLNTALTSPPLSPAMKTMAERQFERMIEDAKDRSKLADLKKYMGRMQTIFAIAGASGPLISIGILTGGAIGVFIAANPALIPAILGVSVGASFPTVQKLRMLAKEGGLKNRGFDDAKDEMLFNIAQFAEKAADMSAKSKPEDFVKLVQEYRKKVRSVKLEPAAA